ncbi:hypothetical protein GW17_00029163 [Ensete ventricosum]|nr:hypothetical protein GW17_00029163 [Ensete ventricosum]RZS01125.1 hypothetical protein BHM03_00030961 [Ensete ventricosum]
MAGWHQAQGFRFRRSRFPPQAISGKGGREEGKSKRETNSRKLREGDRRGTAILWSTRFDGHPCPRHSVWRKRKKRTPPSGRQCASRVRIRGQQRELTEISKCRVGFASSHVRYDATCRQSSPAAFTRHVHKEKIYSGTHASSFAVVVAIVSEKRQVDPKMTE